MKRIAIVIGVTAFAGVLLSVISFITAAVIQKKLSVPPLNEVSFPPVSREKLPKSSSIPVQSKPKLPIPPLQATATSVPILPENTPAIVLPAITEKIIDPKTIVFIGCLYRSQYYASSKQRWNEEAIGGGTGVIISSDGYILTAKHVLDVSDDLLNDPGGRIWTKQYCSVFQTDSSHAMIPEVKEWGFKDTVQPPFLKAETVYASNDQEYQNGRALDFAILKISPVQPLPYVPLVADLIPFQTKDPLITIGYPGMEISQQKLERFDAEFKELTYLDGNTLCDGTIKPCGLRYLIQRYSYTYEKDFFKQTELGVITPFFRGGFSGAPTFYKGNLIGIVTHRKPNNTAVGWEAAYILPTYDIADALLRNGFTPLNPKIPSP